MTDLERAKTFFDADLYATEATGAQIVSVGPHYAKCKIVLDRRHKNALGHVMGGVMYTLADFTFAVATNFDATSPTVTATSSISYLCAPKGDVLFGEARLLRDGKRNCYYQIDVTDDSQTLVAVVTTCGTHL